MVRIDITYEGELHCVATHAPSGTQFNTDAPVDNQGRGESFSPTDLVATALGTCMVTTMGIFARRHEIEMSGASVTVEKEMTAVPVRRIAKLTTVLRMPLPEAHPHREALERAALTCPVHQSLHPDVEKPIHFIWQEQAQ
jgi:putative redox protein